MLQYGLLSLILYILNLVQTELRDIKMLEGFFLANSAKNVSFVFKEKIS